MQAIEIEKKDEGSMELKVTKAPFPPPIGWEPFITGLAFALFSC